MSKECSVELIVCTMLHHDSFMKYVIPYNIFFKFLVLCNMELLGCVVFPCNAWNVSTCIESSAVNNRLQIDAVFQPVS